MSELERQMLSNKLDGYMYSRGIAVGKKEILSIFDETIQSEHLRCIGIMEKIGINFNIWTCNGKYLPALVYNDLEKEIDQAIKEIKGEVKE